MAKSLRSKWRRKMRNIKRERYGKKELIRLKKMLGLPTDEDTSSAADIEMKTEPDISDIANVITAKDIRIINSMVRSGCDPDDSEVDDEVMEITRLAKAKKFRKSYVPRLQRMGKLKSASAKKGVPEKESDNTTVQTDSTQPRFYNEKTFMDQYGSFPEWMNKKSVRKLSKMNKRMKKKQKKRDLKQDQKRHKHRSYSKASMAKETVGLEEAISGLENVAVGVAVASD